MYLKKRDGVCCSSVKLSYAESAHFMIGLFDSEAYKSASQAKSEYKGLGTSNEIPI